MKTALAAAALASGLFLSGCAATGSSTAEKSPTPQPAPTSTTPTPSAAETTAAPTEGAFGPVSFDGIRIGMTMDELKASGRGSFPDGEGDGQSCVWFSYANAPAESESPDVASYDGTVGPKGVELIAAREGMKTPEGISLGSTKAEALAAYPMAKLRPDYGNYRAHVAGQPEDVAYFFTIRGGQVRNLNVSLDTPQCFN